MFIVIFFWIFFIFCRFWLYNISYFILCHFCCIFSSLNSVGLSLSGTCFCWYSTNMYISSFIVPVKIRCCCGVHAGREKAGTGYLLSEVGACMYIVCCSGDVALFAFVAGVIFGFMRSRTLFGYRHTVYPSFLFAVNASCYNLFCPFFVAGPSRCAPRWWRARMTVMIIVNGVCCMALLRVIRYLITCYWMMDARRRICSTTTADGHGAVLPSVLPGSLLVLDSYGMSIFRQICRRIFLQSIFQFFSGRQTTLQVTYILWLVELSAGISVLPAVFRQFGGDLVHLRSIELKLHGIKVDRTIRYSIRNIDFGVRGQPWAWPVGYRAWYVLYRM